MTRVKRESASPGALPAVKRVSGAEGLRRRGMNRLDGFLAYTESHRGVVYAVAAALTFSIAWIDWLLFDVSIGFLYLIPILFTAPAMSSWQIALFAALCGFLTEALDPAQNAAGKTGWELLRQMSPAAWAPGSMGRLVVAVAAFAMTGFFAAELNHRRRMLAEHLSEREKQIHLRREAEQRLRILIETSPLAILTLNSRGEVELANESASQLLGFDDDEPLQGKRIEPFLPLLERMLHRGGGNIRTNVEFRGQRRGGEIFLASVWLSTYQTTTGPGLAAVVWDSSENLRDREGAGLDSMMATSRVLVGALSHEIRNLASAAASAHSALSAEMPASENYQALGTLIRGLEKIASAGLQIASGRDHVVTDLATVLDETRIVIEPALRELDIALAWDIEGPLPVVQGDHHSLLQAFLNLTRNSQQALEGCARRAVRVHAKVENDLAIVRFYDSGPGVPHPDDLFRPFQPTASHAGLGLYITRAILRSHGGGLRYEPQTEGSCFAVELWPVENVNEG
jgi:PAS domain S-box-containing protein